MSGSAWFRRAHRWVSMAFTATVIANFVVRAQGQGEPPPWVTYAPLLPLGLLLLTGLYLFALPYLGRRGERGAAGAQEEPSA
ncbi:hypothetical protein KIH07_04760 [Hydrogenophaga taeniospiralis]|uniref:hypothetical protein n=1 Tax=Hydrogenophaga taeniospiralis TaxID=65656 RepID=UPI001CFA1529|nr:hypothetical protein [Hydrogenophaga taeniospiralis]MCB4363032.1 hypothetical protein [Hydrogenophaga taeniospiralis]